MLLARQNTQRSSGVARPDFLGGILGVALVLLNFWGIGWSFWRHGPVHGLVAVCLPPYAMYRGIACVWEKPKWKEKYDLRVEQIAIVIENALNRDANYQLQSRELVQFLNQWLKRVPDDEKERLRDASINFGFAITEYIQAYLFSVLDGEKPPTPAQVLSVHERLKSFGEIRGFSSRWENFLQDTSAFADLQKILSGPSNLTSDEKDKDRAKTESAVRAAAQIMNRKIEQAVKDLFSR